jgi:hypothetical protein
MIATTPDATSRFSNKSSDSSFADGLASVTRSVLVQYGVCGSVSQVTRRDREHVWDIIVEHPLGPLTLQLRCSEATPPHVIRTAIAQQVQTYI